MWKRASGKDRVSVTQQVNVAPKAGWLQRSYDWIVSYASHPKAVWVLAAVSFIESSVSPIPPLPLLIPMCLANPRRAWSYATVCAVSSVIGGFVGYGIGYLLYETVGLWIISLYGLGAKAAELQAHTHDAWFWILLTKGLTPIPFKIATIMSGFLHFDLFWFTVASFVARFTFFFLFAAALRVYGDQIRDFMEKQLKLATIILLVFLVGGFFVLPAVL
jgi:membrane protein YqaA with SNARE-associated domain